MPVSPDAQVSRYGSWLSIVGRSNIKIADILDLGGLRQETADYLLRLAPFLNAVRFALGDREPNSHAVFEEAGSYQTLEELAVVSRKIEPAADQDTCKRLGVYHATLETVCRTRKTTAKQRTILEELQTYLRKIAPELREVRLRYVRSVED